MFVVCFCWLVSLFVLGSGLAWLFCFSMLDLAYLCFGFAFGVAGVCGCRQLFALFSDCDGCLVVALVVVLCYG